MAETIEVALQERDEAADAKAAALREALETVLAGPEITTQAEGEALYKQATEALAADAGANLLERLRAAEAKAESVDCMREEVKRVRGLLAALDHEQGPRRTIGRLLAACRSLHQHWREAEDVSVAVHAALKGATAIPTCAYCRQVVMAGEQMQEHIRTCKERPVDPEIAELRRRAEESDVKPREPGCQCHIEEGDSACPVHGDEEAQP